MLSAKLIPHRTISCLTLTALGATAFTAMAGDLQPLDDGALSEIRGRDGVSFAVNANVNIGSISIGVTDTDANPATLNMNNVNVTGTIATTMDLVGGTNGSPSYINWAFPDITTTNPLQFGFDLLVNANGTSLGTGVQLQNVSLNGSSFQMTPYINTGITFGMGVNLQIGNALLQPNGRGNTAGQMSLSGISLSAAGSNGSAPWVLADINAQPGIINIVTDANGNPNLQWGIGWPTAGAGTAAPSSGSLQVNNVTFTTPDGTVNLGSSSIGSMQVQYLNVRFHN